MTVLSFLRGSAARSVEVETRVVQPATGAREPEPPATADPVGAGTMPDFPELPDDLARELDVKELCYCAIAGLQDRAAQERTLLWLCETLGFQR